MNLIDIKNKIVSIIKRLTSNFVSIFYKKKGVYNGKSTPDNIIESFKKNKATVSLESFKIFMSYINMNHSFTDVLTIRRNNISFNLKEEFKDSFNDADVLNFVIHHIATIVLHINANKIALIFDKHYTNYPPNHIPKPYSFTCLGLVDPQHPFFSEFNFKFQVILTFEQTTISYFPKVSSFDKGFLNVYDTIYQSLSKHYEKYGTRLGVLIGIHIQSYTPLHE